MIREHGSGRVSGARRRAVYGCRTGAMAKMASHEARLLQAKALLRSHKEGHLVDPQSPDGGGLSHAIFIVFPSFV